MATSRIVKVFRANTGARDLRTVFEDFCTMAAGAIRNQVDRSGHQAREEEYERTRSHYTPEQMDRFAEALAFVALELDAQPRDVLGETYMQLGIANRDQGQFFTPYSVAQLIASIQAGDAPAQLLGCWANRLALAEHGQ